MRAYRNPFCSARVRPGAVRYIHPGACSTPQLVQTLIQQDRWGEIVGPHGSGKSTLVRAMIPYFDAADLNSEFVVLHCRPKGARQWLSHSLGNRRPTDRQVPDLLVVDGAEQLSGWQRHALVRTCRRRELGLLVTSHRSLGLPPLVNHQITSDLARQVVRELLRTWPPSQTWPETEIQTWLDRTDVLLADHEGNLREVLFALYDLFHTRGALETSRLSRG